MVEKTYQRLKFHCYVLVSSLILLTSLFVSSARAQEIRLISDEETEDFLAQIIKPLFQAAGVAFNRNDIYIVEDNSLNAFVADGNRLFVHTGTIIAADSPDELAGVLAHETGHIQGGHILRQKLKNQSLQEVSLASAILAGAAAVASGRGDVAMAAMLGSQSSILTNFTRYRTEEERSADEAAISLLAKTHQSPAGMLAFMKRIAAQYRLQGMEEMPYFRTHPITQERITFFEEAVKKSDSAPNTDLQPQFERVKAKLYAYLMPATQTLRRYPAQDHSLAARYARTIAYFKQLQLAKANKELDTLLAEEPDNPYFHELKGQMYLETGKIAQAKKEYAAALKLLPKSPLLQISYAQALLEDNPSRQEVRQAVDILNQAVIKHDSGFAWLLLSRAYGMQGETAAASYAAAEYSLRIGAPEIALEQLKQAQKSSPSPRLQIKIDDLTAMLTDLLKRRQRG